jgi:hypothetical protein
MKTESKQVIISVLIFIFLLSFFSYISEKNTYSNVSSEYIDNPSHISSLNPEQIPDYSPDNSDYTDSRSRVSTLNPEKSPIYSPDNSDLFKSTQSNHASSVFSMTSCTDTENPDSLCNSKNGDAEPGVIRVAMAKADITPKRSEYLQGYEGQCEATYAVYPSNFTSDLMARILIVDNGKDRLVFLNLEMIFSDTGYQIKTVSKSLLERIAVECHTETGNILLSNTHNHQAPFRVAQSHQEDAIVAAAKEAYKNLKPALIGTGTVNSEFGVSRGGNYTMDVKQPYDNVMTVIRFEEASTGKPIGLVYSLPLHNTMFGNGPGLAANHNLLSCEFTGYASRYIEEKMKDENPDFAAMHINGFYGNSGPVFQEKYYAGTIEELKTAGNAFGEEILHGYKRILTEPVKGEIRALHLEEGVPTNPDKEFVKNETFDNVDNMPFHLTLGRFADIAFIGVNFEPFSIIGARLKAEAPFKVVLPAGNVGGWKGYIPTKEAFMEHAKKQQAECVPMKTPFDENSEEVFYEKSLEALCKLAGVSINRIYAGKSGVSQGGNESTYTFTFDGMISPDKIVVDFAQKLRTDCASDFTLCLYNDSDEIVFTKDFTDNSVNYLGVFMNKESFSKAEIKVRSRYLSGNTMLADLPVNVYGIVFQDISG